MSIESSWLEHAHTSTSSGSQQRAATDMHRACRHREEAEQARRSGRLKARSCIHGLMALLIAVVL